MSAAHADWFRAGLLLILLLALVRTPRTTIFFLTIFVVMLVWDWIFSRSRGEAMNWRFVYAATLLTLLVPIDLPVWQLVFCTSLGVVFGEQIYGGRAHSFLSAVVVSLAFVFYAFPQDGVALIDGFSPLWLLLPAMVLVGYKVLDWLTLLGTLLGMLLTLVLTHLSMDAALTTLGTVVQSPPSFALCFLFILGDGVLSARTNLGKLLSGLLAGVLIVQLNPQFQVLEQLVFALLLTGVSVPLIDWLALQLAHLPSTQNNAEQHRTGA